MKKKYIIISIVAILILALGVSFAYYSTQIIGEGKRVSLDLKELKVVFNDPVEINALGIAPGEWSDQKSFTVKSQTDETYHYNIVIENYLNTLEVEGYLQYKIEHTSTNGYTTTSDDDGWVPLTKSPAARTLLLGYMIELAPGDTHEYKISFRYLDAATVDQSPDMGKMVSGRLGITEGSTPFWAVNHNTLKSRILKDNYVNVENGAPQRTSFSSVYSDSIITFFQTNNAELGETVFYYAGDARNNWVIFGTCKSSKTSGTIAQGYYNCKEGDDLYWRIIRTNEQSTGGGIRLLYSGSGLVTDNQGNKIIAISQNGYIGTSNWYADNKTPYNVGYTKADGTYTSGTTTTDDIRGNEVDSNLKTAVDNFYKATFENTEYEDYIDTKAVYCNDRSGNTVMQPNINFGFNNRSTTPSYACGASTTGFKERAEWALVNGNSKEDRYSKEAYSINGSEFTNGYLDYPMALMTADEVAFAGGKLGITNPNAWYYLNANATGTTAEKSITGSNWWTTISPSRFISSGTSWMWIVIGSTGTGSLTNSYINDGVSSSVATRPVLSLTANTEWLSGNGTPESPYQIKIATN